MRLYHLSLFLYINFSILNLSIVPVVRTTGSYGKFCIIFMHFALQILLCIYNEKSVYHKAKKKYFRLLISSLLGLGVASLLSEHKIISIKNSIVFFAQVLFLYDVVKRFFNHGDTERRIWIRILKTFYISIVSSFIIGVILFFVFDVNLWEEQWSYDDLRIGFAGFLGDRNQFGFLAATGFSVSVLLYLLRDRKDMQRIIYLFSSILFIGFAIISNTRGPILYTIIVCVLISYGFANLNKVYFNIGYTITFLGTILYITLQSKGFIYNIFSLESINKLTSGRIYIWALAIKTYLGKSILWGGGFRVTGADILEQYKNTSYYFEILENLSLHSSYLEILASGGLILFSIFIMFFWMLNKETDIFKNVIIIPTIVIILFESILVIPNIPVSTLFWVVVASIAIEKCPCHKYSNNVSDIYRDS